MIDLAATDWDAVIRVLDQRFPRELEVAILTVRVQELQAATTEPAPEKEHHA